jgi:hypothetical protein
MICLHRLEQRESFKSFFFRTPYALPCQPARKIMKVPSIYLLPLPVCYRALFPLSVCFPGPASSTALPSSVSAHCCRSLPCLASCLRCLLLLCSLCSACLWLPRLPPFLDPTCLCQPPVLTCVYSTQPPSACLCPSAPEISVRLSLLCLFLPASLARLFRAASIAHPN